MRLFKFLAILLGFYGMSYSMELNIPGFKANKELYEEDLFEFAPVTSSDSISPALSDSKAFKPINAMVNNSENSTPVDRSRSATPGPRILFLLKDKLGAHLPEYLKILLEECSDTELQKALEKINFNTDIAREFLWAHICQSEQEVLIRQVLGMYKKILDAAYQGPVELDRSRSVTPVSRLKKTIGNKSQTPVNIRRIARQGSGNRLISPVKPLANLNKRLAVIKAIIEQAKFDEIAFYNTSICEILEKISPETICNELEASGCDYDKLFQAALSGKDLHEALDLIYTVCDKYVANKDKVTGDFVRILFNQFSKDLNFTEKLRREHRSSLTKSVESYYSGADFEDVEHLADKIADILTSLKYIDKDILNALVPEDGDISKAYIKRGVLLREINGICTLRLGIELN